MSVEMRKDLHGEVESLCACCGREAELIELLMAS